MNQEIIIPARFEEAVASLPAPQSLSVNLPEVERLNSNMLPAEIANYVFDVADRTQCPPDFVAIAAVIGCSTIVGNRVRIHPKQQDDWLVVANLWGAAVGPPSAMKSPALKYALQPLHKIEQEHRKLWEAGSARAMADSEVAKMALEEARKAAKNLIRKHEVDAARGIIAEAHESALVLPVRKRLIVNDATVEKLGELLNENPRGLLLLRDELLGLLAKLEDEGFQIDRAFFLEAYNGDASFKYDRIGRGTIEIDIVTLSMVGGIQPSRLAPIVRGAVSGTSADGLLQRLQLAVWPDLSKTWEWRDRSPDPVAARAYDAAFRRLDALNLGTPHEPACLRFSADAQNHFIEWMTDLQKEARSETVSEAMQAHLQKMPATVASLALIFQLLIGEHDAVAENALLMALAWADYLRSHANRIYAAGFSAAEAGARVILERRTALAPEFSARDVHQKAWAGLADHSSVKEAIQVLVATNHIFAVEAPTNATGGRPTVRYFWHPQIVGAGE